MFSIRFVTAVGVPRRPDAGGTFRFVLTTFGEHEERTIADLSFWSEAEYEAQWRAGAARLLSGADSSCLVYRMQDPASDDQHVHCWDLYAVGDDEVVVQSSVWSATHAGGPLDPMSIYDVLSPLPDKATGEGLPPAEWRIGTADLAGWLSTAQA